MTIASIFEDIAAFVEKAEPAIAPALAADFKNAVSAAEAAFTPVADAAITAAVGLITSRFALNAPFSVPEVAFLEGVVAKLQSMLPST